MNIVAIMGSYRKGKTIDTLLDRAIDGAKAARPDANIDKIALIDKQITYCANCMTCRSDPATPYARCVIDDDMQAIYPLLAAADAYIFGTPINDGHETAIMKAFLERVTYVFSRPNPNSFPAKNIPEPRVKDRRKTAIILVSAGVVPPMFRRFCDEATPLLKDMCNMCFNARVIGSLYAGAVQTRGVQPYLEKAYQLGRQLAA